MESPHRRRATQVTRQFPHFAIVVSQKHAWLYRRWSAKGTETALKSAVVSQDGCFAHQTGTRTWKVHLLSGGLFLRQSVTSSTHPCRRTGGDGDGEDVRSEWHLRDEGDDSFPTSFREGQ